jgi:hypothetical protein
MKPRWWETVVLRAIGTVEAHDTHLYYYAKGVIVPRWWAAPFVRLARWVRRIARP